jgi:hypothetical protein
MIPVWLVKVATPLVTKLIKEKLGHVIGYVEEDNELDIKCKEHGKRISKLEKDAHPPVKWQEKIDELESAVEEYKTKVDVLNGLMGKIQNKKLFKKMEAKVGKNKGDK